MDYSDHKGAVNAVLTYLISVIPPVQKISDIRLEEIEKIEEDSCFRIVLSYVADVDFSFEKKREFKEFYIGVDTAKADSTTIYRVDNMITYDKNTK